MLKRFVWALPTTVLLTTSVVAHPKPEAHICGIDPETLTVWPGYGTVGPVYDRGTNFFTVERIEDGVIHHRLYKDECEVSSIRIAYGSDNSSVSTFYGLKIELFFINTVQGDWIRTTQRTETDEAGGMTQQLQTSARLTLVNGMANFVDYQSTDYLAGTITQPNVPTLTFDPTISTMTDPSEGDGGYTPLTTTTQDYNTGEVVTTRHNNYPAEMFDWPGDT